MVDQDLQLRSFDKFIGSLHFWVLIEDKFILQRRLRPKIAKKCLEILLLLYTNPCYS